MISLHNLLLGIQPTKPVAPQLPSALSSIQIRGACLDSRLIERGDLFVALSNAQGDGHEYIAAAAARGAQAMLLKRSFLDQNQQLGIDRTCITLDPEQGIWAEHAPADAVFLIAVTDPAAALYNAALYQRKQHPDLFMIGITGDIGKAGTRQILAAMLKRTMTIYKRAPNAQTPLQIAASLLSLEPKHQAAIFDFRANEHALQIMDLLQPQILIITNISLTVAPKDIAIVVDPYQNIINKLQPHDWLILNYDDAEILALQPTSQVMRYGLNPSADLWADTIDSRGLDGISFAAHHQNETWHIKLPLIGLHSVHTALASAAVGLRLGLSWEPLISGLRSSAQLRILSYPIAGGATLIDDSYNAGPLSSIAALNMLKEFEGRHIGILGTLDTDRIADESGYRAVGSRAADVLDILFVIGEEARSIGEEALNRGMTTENVFFKASHTDVIEQLKTILNKNDIILIKGAPAAALDDIVIGLQVRDQEEYE